MNGMCAKNNTYIHVAWTSKNRVIMACDLYCWLLPQCEVLGTCRSRFPIATQTLVKTTAPMWCQLKTRAIICLAWYEWLHMEQFGIQYCCFGCTKHHPYHKISAFPGETDLNFSSINTPGALYLARWMSKLLYAIKIELLRSQISPLLPKGIVFASGQLRNERFWSVFSILLSSMLAICSNLILCTKHNL